MLIVGADGPEALQTFRQAFGPVNLHSKFIVRSAARAEIDPYQSVSSLAS
jgi:hypothetical protein